MGTVRGFEGMREQGGSRLARRGTKLVMQGTARTAAPGSSTRPGEQPVNLRALQLRFYDHYVKGIDNGIDREPRVRLFVVVTPDSGQQAGGFWLPATRSRRTDRERCGSTCAAEDVRTRAGEMACSTPDRPSEGPDDSFVYDPSKPVPTVGGGLCCVTLGPYFPSGAQDQSAIELRDDVLVYTSAPLAKDLAVVGQVKVKFWAKSSARDTDFTAKFVDVHPDGFAQNVLDRIVRARFRNGLQNGPLPHSAGRGLRVRDRSGVYGDASSRRDTASGSISRHRISRITRGTRTRERTPHTTRRWWWRSRRSSTTAPIPRTWSCPCFRKAKRRRRGATRRDQ